MNFQEFCQKYKLPSEIQIQISRNRSGSLYVKLPDYPGCFTVADSWSELIQNITDAVLTYFEVPRAEAQNCNIYYLPTMPELVEFESRVSHPSSASQINAKFLYLYHSAQNSSYGKHSRIR